MFLDWRVTLLLVASSSQAQDVTIPVRDLAKTTSPVALTGITTAKFDKSAEFPISFKTELSVVNLSGKPILLTVIESSITGAGLIDLHGFRSDDSFFTTELFEPNAVEKIETVDGPFGKPRSVLSEIVASQEPKSLAAIVFIEFADGSIWGDSSEAEDCIRERRDTVAKLKSLEKAYRTAGEGDFLTNLLKPSNLPAIGVLQRKYSNSGGDARVVIQTLLRMLDCARLHWPAVDPLRSHGVPPS